MSELKEIVVATGRCTKVEDWKENADTTVLTRSLVQLNKRLTHETYSHERLCVTGQLDYGKTYEVVFREIKVQPEPEPSERVFRDDE